MTKASDRWLLPVGVEEIQKSPELTQLVSADLLRVLRSEVLGTGLRWRATARPVHAVHPVRLPFEHGTGLPPPIDCDTGARARAVAVVVVLGLVAAAAFTLSQP